MNFVKKNRFIIFSFVLSFVVLLFSSKNSFLYKFNDWVDANAFFTVGKSMFNGVVPYKDIFEQKGLLLYFIYGIGYLFSHKSFYGVFILEVVSFGIFLYYVHRSFSMFYNKKYSYFLLPIMSIMLVTSSTFVHGGSCEEFCLPFFSISLYYFIKYFKYGLNTKEIIINGVMAGLVFMMKYTLLGFWIGFVFLIFINYLFKNELKKSIMFCIEFLIGMLMPIMVGLFYLFVNHAVNDFFNVYFVINMSSYVRGQDFTVIQRVIKVVIHLFELFNIVIKKKIVILPLIIFLIFFIVFGKYRDKILKNNLIVILLFMIFFTFWGLRVYIYYFLPILFLGLFVFDIYFLSFFEKYINNLIDKKVMSFVFIIIFLVIPIVVYINANYRMDMKKTKDDYFQYKYANYINKYEHPTLLNAGFLDVGVFTTSGIIPSTKYFELLNIPYESFSENADKIDEYIRNKEVGFIVYSKIGNNIQAPDFFYKNYKEIYKDIYVFENIEYTAFLFELKDIK